MLSYKGFKVGDRCKTLVESFDYKEKIAMGTEFVIKSFPPYPMKRGSFVYGTTDCKKDVRLSPSEISKI
jgi:hypothetical protein